MSVSTRTEVYRVIDGERDFQDSRWNEYTTTSDNKHSLEEWCLYIEDYLDEAKHILAREARQDADPQVLHIIRKVAAMAVYAMEEHGAVPRKGF